MGRFTTLCLLVAGLTGLAATAPAQNMVKQSWPSHGPWEVKLVSDPQRGDICMLLAAGSDPHPFGILAIRQGSRFLFGVDDRTPGTSYRPSMALLVDDQPLAEFTTFNDPPMSTNLPDDSARIWALMPPLSHGARLTIQARGLEYRISLQGFGAALADMESCRAQSTS